jgi:hypothetical protein
LTTFRESIKKGHHRDVREDGRGGGPICADLRGHVGGLIKATIALRAAEAIAAS